MLATRRFHLVEGLFCDSHLATNFRDRCPLSAYRQCAASGSGVSSSFSALLWSKEPLRKAGSANISLVQFFEDVSESLGTGGLSLSSRFIHSPASAF